MKITVTTNPAIGASVAIVHDEMGETVARFYGERCVQNAQMFIDAFQAPCLGASLNDLARRHEMRITTKPHGGEIMTQLAVWVGGRRYESTAAGETVSDALCVLVPLVGEQIDGTEVLA